MVTTATPAPLSPQGGPADQRTSPEPALLPPDGDPNPTRHSSPATEPDDHTAPRRTVIDRPSKKIVIQELPGGHKAISRARLLTTAENAVFPPNTDELTAAGQELLPVLAAIDGIEIAIVHRHGVLYRPYHPALWSWDEVDTAVVAAFSATLGAELDVIRETPGNGTTS